MSDPIADTPAEPSGQDALNALSPADRSTWELTGVWPDPSKVTTTAAEPDADDEEPVEPEATAAAVETKPEPTPEKPVSKRQQQINDLIRRSTESDLRAKALEAEIQALKAVKPAAEPEKKPEPAAVVDPGDPEPQEAAFEDYKAFVKAQARWEIRQAKREADAETKKEQAAHAETAQREEFATRAKTWIERRDAFITKHPDKADRVTRFLETVFAGTPIGDVIMESEVGADVADYLAANPTEADRIARLAPISALRALGNIEGKFDSEALTIASASAGPAAKTVTTAPAPPMTLAARSASPADPAAAALERGDFAAFEEAENRRATASAR